MVRTTNRFLLGLVFCVSAWSQSPDTYEERPSFGFYAEIAHFDQITFSYREAPKPGEMTASGSEQPSANYNLSNKSDLAWSPIYGIAGQLPFLCKNWLNIQATVGGTNLTYKVHSNDLIAVDSNATDKRFNSFIFIIQGGPELGIPVIADPVSQQFLKPYIFGNIMIGKAFNWGGTHFTNDQYYGLTWGGGVRYAIKSVSFEGGVKWGTWLWKPTYDESVGTADSNKMRAVFYQNFSPFVQVKFAAF